MKIEESEGTGLTLKEIEALKQFQESLLLTKTGMDSDKLENQEYLMNWLRARNLDVAKAEKMLMESLQWRKENNFENSLTDIVPGNFYTKFPYYLDAEDRDGRIIISYSCGTWDIPKMMAAGERNTLYQYAVQMFAKLEEEVIRRHTESKAKGGKIVPYECVWVVDVKGTSLKHLMCLKTIEIILELTSIFEKNFPDTIHRGYFINASSIFTLIFKLMKPFISARTMGNIEVIGCDEKKWKPIILQNIDKDQLRPAFGGTKEK